MVGPGEMGLQLGALGALMERLQFSSQYPGPAAQNPLQPQLRDSMPSCGLHAYSHTCDIQSLFLKLHTHKHTF